MTSTMVAAMAFIATGCVRRTLTITSEPDGALCWLNGREVGRTPVTVDFLHYGEYDVHLTLDGYEPLITASKADAPLWDTIPLDLATELWPAESHSDIRWHYVMQPRLTDRGDLIERASDLRDKLLSEAPVPPGKTGATTAPQVVWPSETETPATVPATEPVTVPAPTEPEPVPTTQPG